MNRVISVILSADSTSLRSQLLLASKAVGDFDNQAARAATSTNALGAGMKTALLGASAAVAGGLAYATKAAADFEVQMRNVNSIAHLSEASLKATSAQVVNLSRTVPQSATTLAKGLYDIASSGFAGADGMRILEQSAIAASAGMTNTATSAKGITAVLNAYGLQAKDAARVSDVLFQTVNVGVLTFEDLTQNLGDVVGTAAAAGISINEVGAAVATMTRAGVPAAEAFTSLNRLTTSLIKPSDELATLYQELGIDIIPALKDPAVGLHGVMEQLRVATGGNVEAFLKLFPEIRAARGAFALASNDGQLYAEALRMIVDESEVAGATQRAFDEQMKAVSNQFKLFINDINAGAIALGTHLLPVLLDVMNGARDLGSEGFGLLQEGARRLAPLWEALRDIGDDVASMLHSVIETIGPLVGLLGQLAATAAIGALNALGEALSAITGFLADHPALVQAVVVMYGVHLVAALAQVTAAFVGMQLGRFAFAFAEIGLLIQHQIHYFGLLGVAIRALPWVAAASSVLALANGLQAAKEQAEALADSFGKGVDLSTLDGISVALLRANLEIQRLEEGGKAFGTVGNYARGLVELLTPLPNTVLDAGHALKAAREEAEKFARASIQLQENLGAVSRATGYSTESVAYYAKALGVDLTQGFKASEGARQKLIDNLGQLGEKALGAGLALQQAATLSIENLQAMAEASDKAAEAAEKAFRKDFDLVSGFAAATKDHEQAIAGVASAQERLADAQQGLLDLQARQAAGTQDSIADQQAYVNAVDRVADAQRSLNQAIEKYGESSTQVINAQDKLADAQRALADLEAKQAAGRQSSISDNQAIAAAYRKVEEAQQGVAEAQGKVAATSLSGFFAQQQQEALNFVTNVSAAAAKGLDPHIIASLLEAGPKQAAPFLQAIAADHSGALVGLANTTQAKLNELSATTIEISRVTQRAINATNVEMAGEYDDAMRILAAKARLGARATATNIATELGIGVDQVRKIANDYVIVLSTKTDDAAKAVEQHSREAGTALWREYNTGVGNADASVSWFRNATNTNMSGLAGEVGNQSNSIATNLTNNVERGVVGADGKVKWFREATGSNLNSTAAETLEAAGRMGWNLYSPIERGVGATDERIVWFKNATGKNLGDLLQQLGAESNNIFQGFSGGPSSPGAPPPNSIANGPLFAEGGSLPRSAIRGTGKTKVQWDEPEAGGEWFLPDIVSAPSKKGRSLTVARQMLDRWGYEMVPKVSYLYGGPHGGLDEHGFDRPPVLSEVPTWPQADEAIGITYEAVRKFVQAAKAWAARRGGGYGLAAMDAYLSRLGIDHAISSGFREGSITASGNLSLHSQRADNGEPLAGDFVGDMGRIFGAFADVAASMQELFYDPAGFSVRGGQQVGWTLGDHWDHVHAATWRGPREGPGLPGFGGGAGGDYGGECDDWIRQGMAIAGVGEDWFAALHRRAEYESGCQNIPQGISDVNSAAGTPAFGPMQVIEPTFNAYRVPGYDDWHNPVHNVAAAIRYIESRYGHISAIDPPRSGYAAGGFHDPVGNLLHVGNYDQGGPLPPGVTMAYNGTGRSEWVQPMPTWNGAGGGGGIDYKTLAKEVAREMSSVLDDRPVQVDARLEVDGHVLATTNSRGSENRRRAWS